VSVVVFVFSEDIIHDITELKAAVHHGFADNGKLS